MVSASRAGVVEARLPAGTTPGPGSSLARAAMAALALAEMATYLRAAVAAVVATTGAPEVRLGTALPWVAPSALEEEALHISGAPAFRTPALCRAAMGPKAGHCPRTPM